MAEKKSTSKRPPQSLNDSHYRFLQDLSAPPKPKPTLSDEDFEDSGDEKSQSKVKIEGRRGQSEAVDRDSSFDDDNVPSFSVFAEFDTPPEKDKPTKVEIEGRRRLNKLSSQVDQENPEKREVPDEPTFSEQEKPAKVKIEGRRRLCKLSSEVDQENLEKRAVPEEPTFSEQEKPAKVKIEGRRRLCKLSSQVDQENPEKIAVPDEPTFADATDFESPLPPIPPPRDINGSDKNGGDIEIRDILNDLSARLEFLSIEKRKGINKTHLVESSLPKSKYNEIEEEKKVDLPEYASAESSFSLASDASDSSSDATKNAKSCTAIADYEDATDRDLHYIYESEISSRADHRNVGDNFMSKQSFVSHVKEVKENKQREQKGNNHVDKVHGATKYNEYKKSEVSKIDKKLVDLGKSSMYQLEEREDSDEDDCVVVSGKKFSKEGTKLKEHDVSNEADVLEEGSSITLRGARYTYKLQGNIAKMLYPHQREGLKWLWSLHCQRKGGILGDDMGLGKTMQICGFLAGLFHSRLIKRAMIVAPKTLLPHWIKELSVVGLSDKTREYFGTCAKARQYELQYVLQDKGILLTTYDIVRVNSKSLRGDKYNYFDDDDESEDNVTWDYMILDEGHLIKNPSTQRAKSLLEIPSAHRIIISGTPIQNNLKELWALFNFCCPELLGDKQGFKERFENAMLRGNEKNATEREKRIGSEVAKELRECIQPYFLRRLKKEVFNEDAGEKNAKLSKKNEMIVWLRLTSCQRQIYEAYLKSELVLSAFDGSPLAALTILKKICDHPLLLTKRAAEDVLEEMDTMLKPEEVNMAEKLAMYIADSADTDGFEENHVNISCKISFILSLLEDLIPKGHNILIFSQTRKMLNLIQPSEYGNVLKLVGQSEGTLPSRPSEYGTVLKPVGQSEGTLPSRNSLESNGYGFLRIDGTTKPSDRLKIVNDFQNGIGAPIFLLTSQVGGLGLTLTRADRVIVVDPAWNPSTDNQSVDRAYRIGQTKDVLVYRLMTCGTVEEKIYRKQIFKGGLFRTATEHKEQTRYFSQQDLRELFSLPAQGFDVSPTQQQLHEEHDRQHIVDDNLKAHINFLESLGIAGVSHHSLLFSKAAPVQEVQGEEELIRKSAATFVGASASSVSVERSVDGAEYAFKPKDIRFNPKTLSPDSGGKLTESDIKERIDRLSKTLENKALIFKLPDNGKKIKKQIAELSEQLCRIKMDKENKKEVIDLDSLTGEFRKALNV